MQVSGLSCSEAAFSGPSWLELAIWELKVKMGGQSEPRALDRAYDEAFDSALVLQRQPTTGGCLGCLHPHKGV